MQSIIDEYNSNHVTSVTPKIHRYVSNDMTSVYYFTWDGAEQYVDQYDLQEYFIEDYENYGDTNGNEWANISTSDKAYALAELVQAQTVGL